MADTIIDRRDDSTAGWGIALIVILAAVVLGALFLYFRGATTPTVPNTGNPNVNVTIPDNSGGSGGMESGGAGGATY